MRCSTAGPPESLREMSIEPPGEPSQVILDVLRETKIYRQHLTILSASIPWVAFRVSTTNLAFSTISA
jgi:hypothetical protein